MQESYGYFELCLSCDYESYYRLMDIHASNRPWEIPAYVILREVHPDFDYRGSTTHSVL